MSCTQEPKQELNTSALHLFDKIISETLIHKWFVHFLGFERHITFKIKASREENTTFDKMDGERP